MPDASSKAAELLWESESGEHKIVLKHRPDTAIAEFLQQQRFGEPGTAYSRLDMQRQLQILPCGFYCSLLRGERLLGSYVLCQAPVTTASGRINGFYRGMLAVDPQAQGQGLGSRLVDSALQYVSERVAESAQAAISWGCIEPGNERSLQTLRNRGLRPLGALQVSTLYRQWPKAQLEVQTLGSEHNDLVQAAVLASQGDTQLQFDSQLAVDYQAVIGADGIEAGARVTPMAVRLHTEGTAWERLDRYLLRHSRAARRRFNPRCFRYLRLDDLVVRPGFEHLWRPFVSTLMARHEVYMAMVVTDPASAVHEGLSRAGLFRPWSRITARPLTVVGTTWNWPDTAENVLLSKPTGLRPIGF